VTIDTIGPTFLLYYCTSTTKKKYILYILYERIKKERGANLQYVCRLLAMDRRADVMKVDRSFPPFLAAGLAIVRDFVLLFCCALQ
jgi:hypothetical protein